MKKMPFKEYFLKRIKNIPFMVMLAVFLLFCWGSAIYMATMLPERLRLFSFVPPPSLGLLPRKLPPVFPVPWL